MHLERKLRKGNVSFRGMYKPAGAAHLCKAVSPHELQAGQAPQRELHGDEVLEDPPLVADVAPVAVLERERQLLVGLHATSWLVGSVQSLPRASNFISSFRFLVGKRL